MKLLALVLLLAVALPVSAQTTYNLTSDPLVDTSYVKVRVDGAEQSACGTVATPCTTTDAAGALVIAYDITAFANTGADVTIDASACDTTGNCSAWSAPLVADMTPPGVPTGLRVVVNVTVTIP